MNIEYTPRDLWHYLFIGIFAVLYLRAVFKAANLTAALDVTQHNARVYRMRWRTILWHHRTAKRHCEASMRVLGHSTGNNISFCTRMMRDYILNSAWPAGITRAHKHMWE